MLQVAMGAAANSTCKRRKVGAVLCDPVGNPVATGWNQEKPTNLRCDEGQCPRGQKSYAEKPAYAPYSDCIATHAEVQACDMGGTPGNLRGYVVVVTEEPCPECLAYLRKRGVFMIWPIHKVVAWGELR